MWLEKAVKVKPADLDLRNQMITLHQDQGNLAAAAEAAQQALAIVPTDVQLLRRMSEVAVRQGDLPGALAWARRAIDAAPAQAANYATLSRIHELNGNLLAAEAAQRRALEHAHRHGAGSPLERLGLPPRRPAARFRTGTWYLRCSLRRSGNYTHRAGLATAHADLPTAETFLRKALERAPNHYWALRHLASIAAQRGEMEQALDYYRRIEFYGHRILRPMIFWLHCTCINATCRPHARHWSVRWNWHLTMHG